MTTRVCILVSCLALTFMVGCGGGSGGTKATVDAGRSGGAGGTTVSPPSSGTGGAGGLPGASGSGGAGGATVSPPPSGTGGLGGRVDASGPGGAGGTTVSPPAGGAGGAGPMDMGTGAGGTGGLSTSDASLADVAGTEMGGQAMSDSGEPAESGAPDAPHVVAVCGDGKVEGAETCDDGNAMPFDGCSADCQLEPDCSGSSGCTSKCGDGIVLGEACDDGNTVSGDGCSSSCKIETGWTCTQPVLGDKMMVPVIYRDFKFSKDVVSPGNDFENGYVGSYSSFPGMVNATLSAGGKPVYSGIGGSAHVASADSFSQWFTNVSGINHATASKMVLWKDGTGNYVNRYGANGEQWNVTTVANWCGTVGNELLDANGTPIPCTFRPQGLDGGSSDGGGSVSQTDCQKLEAQGYAQVSGSCKADSSGTYTAKYIVRKSDGNPLFFPVDGDSFTPAAELTAATIEPHWDDSMSWPYDLDSAGKKILHNFSFTSEIHTWFLYDKTKTYSLDFLGDDDIWVFINKKLAVDLGGTHVAVDGRMVLDADGNCTTTVTPTYPTSPAPTSTKQATSLGLQDGSVYEIAVFQAERQSNGSSLQITFPAFSTAPSACTPM